MHAATISHAYLDSTSFHLGRELSPYNRKIKYSLLQASLQRDI